MMWASTLAVRKGVVERRAGWVAAVGGVLRRHIKLARLAGQPARCPAAPQPGLRVLEGGRLADVHDHLVDLTKGG